ncbi:MAG: TlpA family protein disulfide reductase, partial [Flavobacteriales bacterium]
LPDSLHSEIVSEKAVIQSPNLTNTNLDSIISSNKLTLVFVWKANCTYCKEQIPYLYDIYHKYQQSGLEIVGIAITTGSNDWRSVVEEADFPWVNTGVGPGVKLGFPHTPYLYVLDNNQNVLSRYTKGSALVKFIDSHFAISNNEE